MGASAAVGYGALGMTCLGGTCCAATVARTAGAHPAPQVVTVANQSTAAAGAVPHLGCRIRLAQPVPDADVAAILQRQAERRRACRAVHGCSAAQTTNDAHICRPMKTQILNRNLNSPTHSAGHPCSQPTQDANFGSTEATMGSKKATIESKQATIRSRAASRRMHLAGRGVDDGGGAQGGGAPAGAVVQRAVNVLVPAAAGKRVFAVSAALASGTGHRLISSIWHRACPTAHGTKPCAGPAVRAACPSPGCRNRPKPCTQLRPSPPTSAG